VSVRRDDQAYCDWCYSPLTEPSIGESKRLGLGAEHSRCSETCLGAHAYRLPPDGWNGTASEWPFQGA
jgi:hypothetical protein